MSDFSEIGVIQKKLMDATNRIYSMSGSVGQARQVREYDSDRRKNLLAKHSRASINAGESAAASEAIARANPAYLAEFNALAAQRESAERLIANWEAMHVLYEAARSMLSMKKEELKTIE